ncbi:ribosome biogenesis GTPase [Dysgonomonas sp. PH5-45]|uniref:ribosome small subunit-dependent GTPase A n=1 Tax=unclassified Dysgonomonas TaxID=2630389 RepID=UPI002474A84B|nr:MULTISPECIES: ribosome small subunit-dependent GTPase A [unclassified Dysgonomonas]MDH6355030.1 ribosome biogenesis GTPase [Dysgonomonas sp. PH5-45]MDH6387930.1 ribosome biogenesis GTPase [Dysgonomonas sp. PH5-37]
MEGLVIKNTGSWYAVRTAEGRDVECKIKGNFRLKDIKSTNPIAVGDRVTFALNEDGTGVISDISDRKNYIIRRSSNLSKQSHIIAANLDLCYLLVTVAKPATTTVFIDRFLVSAEAYRIPVCLIFNKIDMYNRDETEYMDALADLYTYIGYPCHKISALENIGIDVLRNELKGKVTLFSGHSGVGKSTLINTLLPGAGLRTASISDYHGKGMHTTTFSEMLELPDGGFIIDTPGIKGFGTVDMGVGEISHYFPEIFKFSEECRFNNCKHVNEPGCAVRAAVENHYISESRYKSYLNILEDGADGKYR